MELTVSLAGGERMPNRLETRRPMPDSMPWPCCRARCCSFPEESALVLSSWFLTVDKTKLPPWEQHRPWRKEHQNPSVSGVKLKIQTRTKEFLLWRQQQSCRDLPDPHLTPCSFPHGPDSARNEPILLPSPPRQRWTEQEPSPEEWRRSRPRGRRSNRTDCWAAAAPYKRITAGKQRLTQHVRVRKGLKSSRVCCRVCASHLCDGGLANLPYDQTFSTNHPGPSALIHLHGDALISWRGKHQQTEKNDPELQKKPPLQAEKRLLSPSAMVRASITLTGSEEPNVWTS